MTKRVTLMSSFTMTSSMMMIVVLVVMMIGGISAGEMAYPRPRLLQDQSCYYEPYVKQLTCQCDLSFSRAFLLLRLEYNVREIGQEVRNVVIHSCPDLLLSLDLIGVDPTSVPFTIRNSGAVTLDQIDFEPSLANRQKLSLTFQNVEAVKFQEVRATEVVQIQATNVKQLLISKSSFLRLPPQAFSVSHTRKLEILDSYFPHIYPRSIEVEKVKEVVVINNEFGINAIKVVSARDGSLLYISCNRLVGELVSPECVTTVAPPVITSPPSPPSSSSEWPSSSSVSTTSRMEASTEDSSSSNNITSLADATSAADLFTTEILIGIAAGIGSILVILLIVIVWLCCRNSSRGNNSLKKEHRVEVGNNTTTDANENIPGEQSKLLEEAATTAASSHNGGLASLAPSTPTTDSNLESMLGEEPQVIPAHKPKFSSPIWIEEIHRNKIFNKQKSVCNDDLVAPLADDQTPLPLTNGAIFLTEPPHNGPTAATGDVTPRRTRVRFPVRSISEILEFEDEDEVRPPVVVVENGEAVFNIGDGDVKVKNGGLSAGPDATTSSPSSNGSRSGGSGGLRFLQTDI